MNKAEELQRINDEILAFDEGELAAFRREHGYVPVPGEGSPDAEIMLVGEAPGENEAKTGRPFVGRAGKFLDELLASAGIPRDDVFITSIVKDRPPKNRDPRPDEITLYAPFLDRQIEVIQPKVIATLGRFAMEYIMSRYGLAGELDVISKLHGRIFDTTIGDEPVKIVALYHPAAAIYNQKLKQTLFEDFKVVETAIS